MKTPNRIRFALLAATMLFTHATFAAKPGPTPPPPPPSSGALVLDWLYPGGWWAENWGLTVAPSGTIYASGYANDGSTARGVVLSSSDSGSTWVPPRMSLLRRYEILVPLLFNDGSPVPETLLAQTFEELRNKFGAASWETQVVQGAWEHQGAIFRDNLTRFFVDVPD